MPVATLALAAAVGVRVGAGAAQSAPEDLLPQSEFDDPIGVDGQTRGVEEAASHAAARAAAQRRESDAETLRYGPAPPPLRTQPGEVLTSVRSTREAAHRVQAELEAGLAEVQVEIVLTTPVDKPAEVRYRLAVPPGARLAGLEACNVSGCRAGVVDPAAGGIGAYDDSVQARGPERTQPVAHAIERDDERGRAIVVRAAPVVAGRDLVVRVRYLAAAPVHGGSVRLVLPARGMDAYAAPTTLSLHAPTLLDPRIAGHPARDVPASFDPWAEVPLVARVPTAAAASATLWTFPCADTGGRRARCARAHVVAGSAPAEPRDLVVALDVSPSTEGPARGRALAAVAAILTAAPEGSRLRVVAFAARARALVAELLLPAAFPLGTLASALDLHDLGSATRFEAVWALARDWLLPRARSKPAPLVVVIGDGGLTEGDARPFHAARRAGVEVSTINVADRMTLTPLRRGIETTGGIVIDAGREADAASRGRDLEKLDERVSALFAPSVRAGVSLATGRGQVPLGPLRAGHELAWQGVVRGAPRLHGVRARALPAPERLALALGARARTDGSGDALALAAVDTRDLTPTADAGRPPAPRKGRPCDRRGPAWRHGGQSSDIAPVALAEDRSCRPTARTDAPTDALGRGMPADPLLGMLRQRIVPVARSCFRRERAGRLDHAVRAVFAFTLADREIVAARVEGEIPEALRTCLLGTVDALEVPRFDGVVRVRYPLRTEREALPKEIELTPAAAQAVDGVLDDD